jgi:flagellar basal-body rod protein FlgB
MVNEVDITAALEAGLKAASLRNNVTANNIANLNTPGFRRSEVEFEELLLSAMESPKPQDLEGLEPKVLQPMDTQVDATGNDVDLDVEVGQMVKNNAAYKTYMRILGKLYRQIDYAIRGE